MAHPRPVVVALFAATLACTSGREPSRCGSDAQCPFASRCSSGVCGAAAHPVAAVAQVSSVETYALVTLDGTASSDPQGSLVEHRWTVSAVDAPCNPPTVASRSASARVRFGCPGQYEVSLVVVNDLGLESDVLTTTVRAFPSSGSSLVTAGPDVTRAHACSGTPMRCAATGGAVKLSAHVADAALALRWVVQPPEGRPIDAQRRVGFAPNGGAAEPAVTIESDGAGIAGDWIFRVEALDEYGVVGAAFQRVSVTNRPPVFAAIAPGAVPHAFDADRSMFTASGEVRYTVQDPDGDPMETAAVWRHVGDGGARFDGESLSSRATFTVEVPYAAPEDALYLLGGEGLERAVELVARDANGAETRAEIAIEIGNRPPRPVSIPSPTVNHAFDGANLRYVATAEIGTWRDPDGDPLEVSGGTGRCPDLSIVDGVVTVECALAYEGVPAVGEFVGTYTLSPRVSDPWTDGPVAVQTFTITNRPPAITVALDPPTVGCQRITSISSTGPECESLWPDSKWYDYDRTPRGVLAFSYTATPTVSDPDGDPVLVAPVLHGAGGSATPLQGICAGKSCVPFRIYQPMPRAPPWVCPETLPLQSISASDGAASVRAPATPWPTC